MKYKNSLRLMLVTLMIQSSITSSIHARLEIDPNITIEITRKQPSNNTSAILAGLAQTFLQLGQAVSAQSKQEQQQAALSIIGTAFNVAAHLAHHRPRDEKQTEQVNEEEVSKALIDLTLKLLTQLEKESFRNPQQELPESLSDIAKAQTPEEKISIIMHLLSTIETAKKYLNELIQATEEYLNQNITPLYTAIKNALLYSLNPYGYRKKQEPNTEENQKLTKDATRYHQDDYANEIEILTSYLRKKSLEYYQVNK